MPISMPMSVLPVGPRVVLHPALQVDHSHGVLAVAIAIVRSVARDVRRSLGV